MNRMANSHTRLWLMMVSMATATISGHDLAASSQVRSDSAGIEIVEYADGSTAPGVWRLSEEPLVSIGVLDGDEPYIFSLIGDIHVLADGSVVAEDFSGREIRVFDRAGMFVNRIGRRGEGPGEFRSIRQTRVSGDTVQVWDGALDRLSTFRLSGEFLGSQKLPQFQSIASSFRGFFADGSILGAMMTSERPAGAGIVKTQEAVVRWSPMDPTRFDTITTIELPGLTYRDEDGVTRPIEFSPEPNPGRVAGDDAVYIITGETVEYRAYDLMGRLTRIVRMLESPQPIGSRFLDAFKADRAKRVPSRAAVYEAMPYPERFPMLDRIVLDRVEGNIWVRRYRPTSGPHEWHVFDPQGSWVSSIEIPDQLEVRAVSGDVLAGRWVGEYDVQSIRLYQLVRQ